MKLPPKRCRLARSFYDRPTEQVARELLGKVLLRRVAEAWIGGFIVETEAYLPCGDLASHSARGKTPSNAAMFGRPGTLYVYPIHAKFCMNVVTESTGKGSAVLIRALEPIWGIEQMMQRRGTDRIRQLTRGPAMLCQALQVDRAQDKTDLVNGPELLIAEPAEQVLSSGIGQIVVGPRIGISSAADLPLRFFLDGNWFVSGRASDHRTRPVNDPRPRSIVR
jgi:DNA-3-methyladenine glycosylase